MSVGSRREPTPDDSDLRPVNCQPGPTTKRPAGEQRAEEPGVCPAPSEADLALDAPPLVRVPATLEHARPVFRVARDLAFHLDGRQDAFLTVPMGTLVEEVYLADITDPFRRRGHERSQRRFATSPRGALLRLVLFEYGGRVRAAEALRADREAAPRVASAPGVPATSPLDHLEASRTPGRGTGPDSGGHPSFKLRLRYGKREGRAHASRNWGPRQRARGDVVKTLEGALVAEASWQRTPGPSEETTRAEGRPCNKCDGLGRIKHYTHIEGGECFRCRGTGVAPAPRGKEESKLVYTTGPTAGMKVVDLRRIAGQIASCCAHHKVTRTSGGAHGSFRIAPTRCKRGKACPVCGNHEAAERGRLVEEFSSRRTGQLVMVTLTHRDRPAGEESVKQACDRFDAAYLLLTDRKFKRWWKKRVLAGALGFEATAGATGRTVHPHLHGLIEIQPDLPIDVFREELATFWSQSTIDAVPPELVAATGLPASELGWDRASGTNEGQEAWCQLVAGAPVPGFCDKQEEEKIKRSCYQISKYFSPLLNVRDPERLAEFMVWGHGRKMTRWIGRWNPQGKGGAEFREEAKSALEVTRQAERAQAEREGWAPQIGDPLPGERPVDGSEAKKNPEVQRLRAWSAMAGLHARILAGPLQEPLDILERKLEDAKWWNFSGLDGSELEDQVLDLLAQQEALKSGRAKIAERMEALRLRTDVDDALAEWEAWQETDASVSFDEGKLNRWYQARDKARRQAKRAQRRR
jgi:hypothetical protein